MKKKSILLLALLLALSLCACGTPAATEDEPEGEEPTDTALTDLPGDGEGPKLPPTEEESSDQPGQTSSGKTESENRVEFSAYSFCLPQGVTAEEGNGDVDLMRNGKVIGGVWTLDYPDAEALREDTALMDALMEIIDQVAPDNEDFEQSRGDYGDFMIRFVQADGASVHCFFAQGDKLYDAWLWANTLSEAEGDTFLGSFALKGSGAKG